MNPLDIILITALAAWFVLAVRSMKKNKCSGCSGCSGCKNNECAKKGMKKDE